MTIMIFACGLVLLGTLLVIRANRPEAPRREAPTPSKSQPRHPSERERARLIVQLLARVSPPEAAGTWLADFAALARDHTGDFATEVALRCRAELVELERRADES